MSNTDASLRDILLLTKDGEWGKESSEPNHTEMLVIRGTDFENVRFGDLSSVPRRFIPNHIVERKKLQPNDILIETAGGSKDRPTGRTVFLHRRLFENDEVPITCASFSRFLRVDSEIAEPEYVFWYLQYLYSSGQLDHFQVQHTGVARFQYTNFAESTPIPLPRMDEQRAIAHILGTLDDKIELNRRMNETLEEIARTLFTSWFVTFDPVRVKAEGHQPEGMDAETAALFPDSFVDSELGEIPAGWNVSTLEEAATIVGGSTPSTKEPRFWGGEIPFTTPRDMSRLTTPVLLSSERSITVDGIGEISSGQLPVGTVLMSSRAPIGYLAITYVETTVNQGMIGCICDKGVPNTYIINWLKVNMNTIIGHANGTTFLEISRRNFRPIKLVLPPQKLLGRFDSMVSALFDKVALNQRQSGKLAEIRDALLPKLLSGEVRVAEIAEV